MEQSVGYARFLRRFQALSIDSVLIPIIVIGTIYIASRFNITGVYSAVLASLEIFLLEPFLISFTGATIGQHIVGIKVINKKSGKNLNIFSAVIRFIVKILLGSISLISIFITKCHQGIHDILVGSIVILSNQDSLNKHELIKERIFELPEYTYPSKVRKILFAIIYNLLIIGIIILATGVFLSEQCLTHNLCETTDNIIMSFLQMLWLICIPVSIVLCLKGLLLGCRRKLINNKP